MTQFWQASIIYKCRWWIWVWNIFTCHLTCRCIWRNCSVSACACRERGRSPNLWLYLFGHFHCASYFTWCALEKQYPHLKTKAQLLTGIFVCKHQVVVWNSVLSEHFEAICTGKDGLRWVTFSAEYVGQLCYYYISGKLEHIYPEKQKDNSEKDNGSKHMEGVMQGEGMLYKICIAYWMNYWMNQILQFFEQHQWQTVEYCHRKYASEEVNITNAVDWWVDEGTLYRQLHMRISQDYLKPCEVIEGNTDWWTSMTSSWPPYFNVNPVPPITYWWIWSWMHLQGGSKSPLVHTLGVVQQWSTLPVMLK